MQHVERRRNVERTVVEWQRDTVVERRRNHDVRPKKYVDRLNIQREAVGLDFRCKPAVARAKIEPVRHGREGLTLVDHFREDTTSIGVHFAVS